MKKDIAAIVLAAGKGTRINARNKNKVLYRLADRPMIGYTLNLLKKSAISPIVIVVGYKKEEVVKYLGTGNIYVKQGRLLGTGHAVKKAIKSLSKRTKDVLILYGDHSAFYTSKIINKLIKHHQNTKARMTFITVTRKDPKGYGRIIRNKTGKIEGIREEKDASTAEKKIKEINSGTYCFKINFLNKYLPRIKKNPIKGEYYLTDLVEMALKDNLEVEAIKVADEKVSLGINTKKELDEADRQMRKKLGI